MMWTSRPSAVAAVCNLHASRARAPGGHHFWRSHGERDACDLRAVAVADGRFGRIVTQRFANATQ
eukprot:1300534-Lingulodinium_polyedra.AAC.1